MIHKAHIPKIDKFSKNDSYVRVYVSDKLIGTTEVAKNTHEPLFNANFETREQEWIRLVIVDQDDADEDDFITSVSFCIQDMRRRSVIGRPVKMKFKLG